MIRPLLETFYPVADGWVQLRMWQAPAHPSVTGERPLLPGKLTRDGLQTGESNVSKRPPLRSWRPPMCPPMLSA